MLRASRAGQWCRVAGPESVICPTQNIGLSPDPSAFPTPRQDSAFFLLDLAKRPQSCVHLGVGIPAADSCLHAERIIDQYAATLAYRNHYFRRLCETESMEEYLACCQGYEEASSRLADASAEYWKHIEQHNCRKPKRRRFGYRRMAAVRAWRGLAQIALQLRRK